MLFPHFGARYYSLNLNSMSTPMKAYDLLCSRFHIPWVWKCVRQSQTGVRWKIDGTISENHHDVSHLISVRSECVRLYFSSLLNNPSVPISHIKQQHEVLKLFALFCPIFPKVCELVCLAIALWRQNRFAKLVKWRNPAKFTSLLSPYH